MITTVYCPICGTKHELNTASFNSLLEGVCCGTGGLVNTNIRNHILKGSKNFWNVIYKELSNSSPLADPRHIPIVRNNRNILCLSDGNKPSKSMKDRASSVAIWDAINSGKSSIAVASCGNAAVSTAKLSKKVGIQCNVFIPKQGTEMVQKKLKEEDARIFLYETYSSAVEACKNFCSESSDSYCRLTGINPLTRVGKSTIYESLKSIKGTDLSLYIPVGDGNLASSIMYYDTSQYSIYLYSPILAQNKAFERFGLDTSSSAILPLDVKEPQDYSLIKQLSKRPNITLTALEDKYFKINEEKFNEKDLDNACEVFYGGLHLAGETDNNRTSIIFHTGIKWC